MSRPRTVEEALTPLRAELLRRAEATAAGLTGAADRDADRALDEARARADALLAAARDEGAADVAALLVAERSRVRRRTRARVLGARSHVVAELERRAVAESSRLLADPGYPGWRAALAAAVRAELGPEAGVADSPDGGVVGRAGTRRVDASLPALVRRVLDREAAGVDELWADVEGPAP